MITKWKLRNFKSVAQETELELAPLTIFSGANSSGKSTLLQSILLVAQTLGNRVGSRSVVLNGNLVRLGQFDDLRNKKTAANQISLGWTCRGVYEAPRLAGRIVDRDLRRTNSRRIEPLIREVKCEITLEADRSGLENERLQIQPRLSYSTLVTTGERSQRTKFSHSMKLERVSPANSLVDGEVNWFDLAKDYEPNVRNSLNYAVMLDRRLAREIRSGTPAGEPIGCIFRHFLPEQLSIGFDQSKENARLLWKALTESPFQIGRPIKIDPRKKVPNSALRLIQEKLGTELAEMVSQASPKGQDGRDIWDRSISVGEWRDTFRETPRQQLLKALWGLRRDRQLREKIIKVLTKTGKAKPAIELMPCPRPIRDAVDYVEDFFAKFVKYLGPLRDEPKPLYSRFPQTDPKDVGLRGEMTAAVLDYGKSSIIDFVPSSCFRHPELALKPREGTLQSAVFDWLQYLGVATEVAAIDRGKLGHEIKVGVTSNEPHHDLMHVGVGVSQVLPILVMCLLADSGTTFVIEQPELHLHPKVQSRLGDFFLSIATLGKQCIIETHSEHLINRLRLRAAIQRGEKTITEELGIYFVTQKEGQSSFEKVEVNEFGAILDWPDGFFDESQREAEKILLAAVQKRKSLQNGQ